MATGTRMALSDTFGISIQDKDCSISKGLDVRMWKEWGWLIWALSFWEMDRLRAVQGAIPEGDWTCGGYVYKTYEPWQWMKGKVDRTKVDEWSLSNSRPVARRRRRVVRPLCSPRNLKNYWVGQKVHLSFSIRGYGKAWMNFAANPLSDGTSVPSNSK